MILSDLIAYETEVENRKVFLKKNEIIKFSVVDV
jgi:hypothetical protein